MLHFILLYAALSLCYGKKLTEKKPFKGKQYLKMNLEIEMVDNQMKVRNMSYFCHHHLHVGLHQDILLPYGRYDDNCNTLYRPLFSFFSISTQPVSTNNPQLPPIEHTSNCSVKGCFKSRQAHYALVTCSMVEEMTEAVLFVQV